MMVNKHFRENCLIVFTLLASMILIILPLPQWALWARPQWVFITLVFWFMQAPRKVGPGIAFIVGLYVDVLLGSALGLHAFVYVFFCYFVLKFVRMIQATPVWQQVVGIFVASLLNLSLQWIVLRVDHSAMLGWHYWLPALSNSLMWPWLYLLLRNFKPKQDFDVIY